MHPQKTIRPKVAATEDPGSLIRGELNDVTRRGTQVADHMHIKDGSALLEADAAPELGILPFLANVEINPEGRIA